MFLDQFSSGSFPGVGWYQVTHLGSASPPIPALRSLSDGCSAALPLLPAVAGQHLGLCLAHESITCKAVRMSASLNAPAASLHGMVALNCQAVNECRMAFHPGVEGKGIATKLL